jgi:hypothetical protein
LQVLLDGEQGLSSQQLVLHTLLAVVLLLVLHLL